MDDMVKQLYPELVKYNKQVGMSTYMLAAKNSGITVAQGAYNASVSLSLFGKALQTGSDKLNGMTSVKNYWSMLMSTYKTEYTKLFEKNPDQFVGFIKDTTALIDASNADPITKLYTK